MEAMISGQVVLSGTSIAKQVSHSHIGISCCCSLKKLFVPIGRAGYGEWTQWRLSIYKGPMHRAPA